MRVNITHLNWYCYRSRRAVKAFLDGFGFAQPGPGRRIVRIAQIGVRFVVEVAAECAYRHRVIDYDYAVGDGGGDQVEVPEILIADLGEELAVCYRIWADTEADEALPDDDGICPIDLDHYRRCYPFALAFDPADN